MAIPPDYPQHAVRHVDRGPIRLGPSFVLGRSLAVLRSIVVRDGLGQRRDSVLPRHDACLESELPRRVARHGADAGHARPPTGGAAQVLARRRAPAKWRTVDELVNVTTSTRPVGERPAKLARVLAGGPRAVGRHLVDPGARGLELASRARRGSPRRGRAGRARPGGSARADAPRGLRRRTPPARPRVRARCRGGPPPSPGRSRPAGGPAKRPASRPSASRRRRVISTPLTLVKTAHW